MERIEDYEEAEEILELPIEDTTASVEIAEEVETAWILVGSLQQRKGVDKYVFDVKSKLTMYSEELNIRRWPTSQEIEASQE